METNNTKGALHGLCNRSACLKPGAEWYNHSTREHYCEECATLLNNDEYNRRDAWEMFGHDLCTKVEGGKPAEFKQVGADGKLEPIPYVNPYMQVEKVQVLKECKGRHTYVQKGQHETTNGFIVHEWYCKNCGHQL